MSEKEIPLISVLTLCYNTGKYVIEALDCIKLQTYPNIQHIIIDDFSTDNSPTLISEWIAKNNHDCIFIQNNKNKGIPSVFNSFMKIAQGKYATWISDDLWDKNRIQRSIEAFESLSENVGVLFGLMNVYKKNGLDLEIIHPAKSLIASGYLYSDNLFRNDNNVTIIDKKQIKQALLWRCFIPAPSVTIRRMVYEKIGPYDESLSIEDFDYWLRTAEKFDFAFLPEITATYRLHETNFTSGLDEKYINSIILTLKKHIGNANKELKKIARKHIREEIFRIAIIASEKRHTKKAIKYFASYISYSNFSFVSFKESIKIILSIIKSMF